MIFSPLLDAACEHITDTLILQMPGIGILIEALVGCFGTERSLSKAS